MGKLSSPDKTILYVIENCIKSYRKFAQKNVKMVNADITLDQALLLLLIQGNSELRQQQLAAKLFKDNASITRMTQLMISKNYLSKTEKLDKREFACQITDKGERAIEALTPIIMRNRKAAMSGISPTELATLETVLKKIIHNCERSK